MNKITKICCTILSVLIITSTSAQDLSQPAEYMSHIGKQMEKVNQTYMNYLSAVSHGKSARKVEKLREKTVNTIFEARGEVAGTPPFKGDRTLKDATVEYLKICYAVFNEDYARIVNMEDIAEQSYDAMEAYLLAKEKAIEKLKLAGESRTVIARAFAQKNNVQLIETKDELDLKMEKSGQVNEYYNNLYLIFFKSYKQEMYVIDAMNRSDMNGLEQNRNALLNFATAGLEELDKIEAFNSDASLLTACKKALQYYKEVAERKMNPVTEYMLANENFKKTKKAVESKAANQRTQTDIDNYNKAIAEINKVGNTYNKANSEMNKERKEVLDLWNSTVKRFMDVHIPYSK